MKQITPVSIWDKGTVYQAEVLNAYGTYTQLGKRATFYYSLSVISENGQLGLQVAQSNIDMGVEEYAEWGTDDDYVWDFVASKLNLTIIGDWEAPVPVAETTPVMETTPIVEI